MNTIAVYQSPGAIMHGTGFTDLFQEFTAYIDRNERTTRGYLTNLRQFAAWCRYADVPRPERQDIINYRNWLAVEHDAIRLDADSPAGWSYRTTRTGDPVKVTCRPATVKAYLQSVKQFFAWAASCGYIPTNIAQNIHAPKVTESHKKDSLTATEVQAIECSIAARAAIKTAAAADARKDSTGKIQRSTEQGKRLYAMYLLAVNAGLRTIEISRANVRDLETKGGNTYLYIWGKGRSEPDQKKPIAPEVKAAIDDYLRSRSDSPTGSSPLFVSTGNRSRGKRIATTTISTMLKTAMVEAGYDSDRLTAHSLRHTTGQAVMEITRKNIYQTQMYMRHSSPKTTEVYLDNDTTEQDADIARKLYQKFHAAPQTAVDLSSVAALLTPEQLQQLAALAAASHV